MKIKYLLEYVLNSILSVIILNKHSHYKNKAVNYSKKIFRRDEIIADKSNDIKIINKSDSTIRLRVKGKNNKVRFNTYTGQGNIVIDIMGDNNSIMVNKITAAGNIVIKNHCNNGDIQIEFLEAGNLTIYNGYACSKDKISGGGIYLGDNVNIASGLIFNPHSNTQIKIGNDCMFSDNIHIRNTDGHPIYDINTKECINKVKAGSLIDIGNHVWIGYGATILKNTAIGNDSIVGTQAVVTKRFVEPNSVIAGNPAKVVKQNITWTRENADFFD